MRDDASPASGNSRWAASAKLPLAQALPQKTRQAITTAPTDIRKILRLQSLAPRPDLNVPKLSSRRFEKSTQFLYQVRQIYPAIALPAVAPKEMAFQCLCISMG
jgi:hypothetical protein